MGFQPIRWDNVSGPQPAAAAQPMLAAAQLMNNAFSGLQDQVKAGEAIDANNAQVQRNNNTTDFLNGYLGKFTDASQLKAAMDSGDVAKQLASYGHAIDPNAVRGAADARFSTLMQQKQNEIAYNHAITDERVAPLMDQYKAAAIKGDQAGMDAAQTQYQSLGGRDLAGLVGFADQRAQTMKERGYLDANQALGISKGNAEITHMKNQDANAAAQLGLMRDQFGLAKDQFGLALQDHMLQEKARLRTELGGLFAQDPSSQQGQQAIFDQIDKASKDPNTQANMRRAAMDIIRNTPNATVGDVTAAVLGMDNNRWYKVDAMVRAGAASDAKDLAGRSTSLAQQASIETRKASVANDLAAQGTFYSNLMAKYGLGAKGTGTTTPGTTVPNPFGMPAPTPLSPTAGDQQVADAAAAIKASMAPGTYGPNGFIPATSDPVAKAQQVLEATKGNIPSAPTEKVWIGNNFVVNPAFKAWQSQYGAAAALLQERQSADLARRMANLHD